MAKELLHKDAGAVLTRTEDNAVDRHYITGGVANDFMVYDATNAKLIGKTPTETAAILEASIEAAIDTLANLTSIQGHTVTLTGAFIRAGAHSLTLTTSATTSITLPTTGTVATLAGTETFTNKTLTTPIIASIYQDAGKTKLMTVPNTASDTLVALAATQTLTNKTLTSPTINGTIATTGLTLPAHITGTLTLSGGYAMKGASDSASLAFLGGSAASGHGAAFYLDGNDHAGAGSFRIYTSLAALNADTLRLTVAGKADVVLATWSATNQVFGASYASFTEMTAPGAGAANTARIYAVVGGDTFTDLAAVFQDGTVAIFAQETTPLDSPLFTEPSGTEVKYVMKKPHPGLIQFIAKYPDGRIHVLQEIQYHDADKIAANKGASAPLPQGWFVETAKERELRLEAKTVKIVEVT